MELLAEGGDARFEAAKGAANDLASVEKGFAERGEAVADLLFVVAGLRVRIVM
jgi:hypothetical protein